MGISDILNIINKLDKLEFLYNRTIGADFTTFNLKINNTAIRLIIFDTRGLEGYKTFITSFCRNVSLGIFVYAINSRYSFERINLWVKELKKVKINLKKFLIGTKANLEEEREVSYEEGQKYKEDNNFDMFMEISRFNDEEINNIFIEAGKLLYEIYESNKSNFYRNLIN